MTSDSINDDILRIKRALAAQHGNDIRRIAADARKRQTRQVTLPARPYRSDRTVSVKTEDGTRAQVAPTPAAH